MFIHSPKTFQAPLVCDFFGFVGGTKKKNEEGCGDQKKQNEETR